MLVAKVGFQLYGNLKENSDFGLSITFIFGELFVSLINPLILLFMSLVCFF